MSAPMRARAGAEWKPEGLDSEEAVVDGLTTLLTERFCRLASFQVLDAGCGARCALTFGSNAVVTGADISGPLLEQNQRLDHRIASDLARAPLPAGRFDAVVCWNVLEHLEDPPAALDNLARSIAPGGLLILKAPNPGSAKGIVTKYTPHRFHRWVYRRSYAGDADPFPTRFHRSIAPPALRSWARGRGLTLRWSAFWEADIQRRLRGRLRLEGAAWRAVEALVHAVSLGRIEAAETEFLLVFERA